MKKKIYIQILFFITFGLLFTYQAKSDILIDTLAFIKIANSHLIDNQTLEFDILIERKSDKWLKFANGSFSLGFDDTTNFTISPKDFQIYSMKSELKQDIEIGESDIPTRGYRTDYQIYNNRLSITILGPENYEDCDSVSLNKTLLLGTYRVQSKNNDLPYYKMRWLRPYTWYQACAFKLENDSLINNELKYYLSDDNVSMEDSTSITYVFIDDTTSREVGPVFFSAAYIGQKNSEYDWKVKNEYDIVGYSVYRTMEIPGASSIKFDDQLLGTWRDGEKHNPAFKALGKYDEVVQYGEFPDQIEFRGGNYIYSLYASVKDTNGLISDVFLDSAKIPAPRAVIVEARASENPFRDETTIEYKIDDDCYITAYANDLLGKEIKKLKDENGIELDKIKINKGVHTTRFVAPELASQGLYNVIITAYPILDPTVEVSRAVVKVQLVR